MQELLDELDELALEDLETVFIGRDVVDDDTDVGTVRARRDHEAERRIGPEIEGRGRSGPRLLVGVAAGRDADLDGVGR
jgi:hypothetical protein